MRWTHPPWLCPGYRRPDSASRWFDPRSPQQGWETALSPQPVEKHLALYRACPEVFRPRRHLAQVYLFRLLMSSLYIEIIYTAMRSTSKCVQKSNNHEK